MSTALASILVPVYNSARFLPALVASVRAQTYPHWELVLVDDGSTDDTRALITQYASQDTRIMAHFNPHNLGPSATLNRAARLARGELLFRLDTDDTMLPERLQRQLAYLEAHPGVGLLGSHYVNVSPEGRPGSRVTSPILGGPALAAKFLFVNAMGHSTVVYRRQPFEQVGGYDESLRASLDYDLLGRLSTVTPCAMLPRVLVRYLTHRENITTTRQRLQLDNAADVQRRLLHHYGFVASPAQLRLHAAMCLSTGPTDTPEEYSTFLLIARQWLRELQRQNDERHIFPPREFARVTAEVHTRLYARASSPLRLRDYLRLLTPEFRAFTPRHAAVQFAHSLKRGW